MKLLKLSLAALLMLFATGANSKNLLPKMLPISGGEIEMHTCKEGIKICSIVHYEVRKVQIKDFYLSETEVTMALWDECVKAKGCHKELSDWAYKNRKVKWPCVKGEVCQYPFDEYWGRNTRPVINVSWGDVQQFIKWINSQSNIKYRLPTSAEWEYAATAKISTNYPWGDILGKYNTNCGECGTPWSYRQTAQVKQFKSNQFGIFDLYGNVSEWTSSCEPLRGKQEQKCNFYIARGGNWRSEESTAIPANAIFSHFDTKRSDMIGFRLAADIIAK